MNPESSVKVSLLINESRVSHSYFFVNPVSKSLSLSMNPEWVTLFFRESSVKVSLLINESVTALNHSLGRNTRLQWRTSKRPRRCVRRAQTINGALQIRQCVTHETWFKIDTKSTGRFETKSLVSSFKTTFLCVKFSSRSFFVSVGQQIMLWEGWIFQFCFSFTLPTHPHSFHFLLP